MTVGATAGHVDLRLWGSELSTFCLKLAAMLTWAELDHRWLPAEGSRVENLRAFRAIRRARGRREVLRHGGADELDEYPAVPYLLDASGRVHYDSTALAAWIDEAHPSPHGRLVPEEPGVEFVARLIDEAFDEFGLYLVHHNRWVLSAGDNDAGDRFAAEFTRLAPRFASGPISRRLAARQTRRLPYLFSVAPDGLELGLPAELTPPARPGFPPTHDLLDQAWHGYLDAMEGVFTRRPYLLGDRFTLADASAYGQLSMNLTDPPAARALAERAPVTFRWLTGIRDGAHVDGADPSGELRVDELEPLLGCIADTFVPLMQQNETAYEVERSRGETRFNEAAFDDGRALFDGELTGLPFRAVVKSFQVRTWRDLRSRWGDLPADDRAAIATLTPALETAF